MSTLTSLPGVGHYTCGLKSSENGYFRLCAGLKSTAHEYQSFGVYCVVALQGNENLSLWERLGEGCVAFPLSLWE